MLANILINLGVEQVVKDNQRERLFYPVHRMELVRQLTEDAKFLKNHDCMDYSLMIGVHKVKEHKEEKKHDVPVKEVIVSYS